MSRSVVQCVVQRTDAGSPDDAIKRLTILMLSGVLVVYAPVEQLGVLRGGDQRRRLLAASAFRPSDGDPETR